MIDDRQIVDFYYRSNYGTFSEYLKGPRGDLLFSQYVSAPDFNHLIHYRGNPSEELKGHLPAFVQRDRKPVLYITPLSEFYNDRRALKDFKRGGEDAWLWLKDPTLIIKPYASSAEVEVIDERKQEDYIGVFSRAFGSADDVYGALPEGYTQAERNFFKPKEGFLSTIALCKINGVYVGGVRAVQENDLCFIYSLGVEKKFRTGRIAAQALGSFIINHVMAKGAKNIFIQTESGTVLERLYRIAGFKRLFTGTYYSLE